eukprot:2706939-Pleurochrysis_carterae.AAC.9
MQPNRKCVMLCLPNARNDLAVPFEVILHVQSTKKRNIDRGSTRHWSGVFQMSQSDIPARAATSLWA